MTNILEGFWFFCGFPKFPLIVIVLFFFVTGVHFIERVLEHNVAIRKTLEFLSRFITLCTSKQKVVMSSIYVVQCWPDGEHNYYWPLVSSNIDNLDKSVDVRSTDLVEKTPHNVFCKISTIHTHHYTKFIQLASIYSTRVHN